MAKEKRMISSEIYIQDEFLDMPPSARDLYTYLNLNADDEGFVGKTKSVMRQIRASEDDLKILLAKRYLLSFDGGSSVVVIKHWLIHNSIRQDRIIETNYKKEKEQLKLNEYGAYTEKKNELLSDNNGVSQVSDMCQPNNTNLILSNSLSLDLSIKEVIEYLNSKTNSHYRFDNTRTRSLLNARLKNYSIDDIKKVIDKKCDEWLNDKKMVKYLRPETLFNETKFESYFNQKEKQDEYDVLKKFAMEDNDD